MSIFSSQSLALGVILLASSTASAGIVNLGTANDYNVFVFGDNAQSNTDAEGRVAVGGNASFGGYTIASKLTNGTTNLVVGGNYSNRNNTVTGNVAIGGNAAIVNPTIRGDLSVNGNVSLSGHGTINGALTHGGSLSNPNTTISGAVTRGTNSLPVDFDSEQTYLTKLSSDLAKAVGYTYGNGVDYEWRGFTLTGQETDVNVFNIKGSDLSGANSFTIKAPAGATVVINVDGTAVQMRNLGFSLKGVDKQTVLFNFHEATSLLFSGIGIQGSVLAPLAAISFNNGNIDGTMIGASIAGNGESHNDRFRGDLSPLINGSVPEPATVLSTFTGLVLVGGAACRRRRRPA